jgi:peptide/nickel transport system permease protein
MQNLTYIIKRLLLALLIVFGVSMIIYFLIRLMPVDYITSKFSSQIQGGGMTQEDLNRILALYGLDDNSFMGIIKGYFEWFGNFMRGDMGVSFQYGDKVENVIGRYMGTSFIISFISLILQMLIAIPLGIKCACNQYGKFDYFCTFFCMVSMAFPSFFLGNMVIKWFAVDLGWFETGGIATAGSGFTGFRLFLDQAWHLVLPLFVLTVLSIGGLMRYTRTNTLEVLNADYIRTARAKGLSENKVVYKHVFRNTLIPLVTQLAFTLPGLFGGAMITETIFDIPGIGKVAYDAIQIGDIPLAMGYNMFIAVLTVAGILLADLMYAVVDPRVKIKK